MKRRTILAATAAVMISGCGWRSAGGGEPGRGLDAASDACEKVADRETKQSENPLERATQGNIDWQKRFESCMKAKGYERDNPGEAFRRFFCSLGLSSESKSCKKK